MIKQKKMKLLKHKGGRRIMAMQTWIIIALLALSYYQYANPEKANDMLDPVWGSVKDFISNNNPVGNNDDTNVGVTCPDVSEPVCGSNGEVYKNSCEAALDGQLEVTPGTC